MYMSITMSWHYIARKLISSEIINYTNCRPNLSITEFNNSDFSVYKKS